MVTEMFFITRNAAEGSVPKQWPKKLFIVVTFFIAAASLVGVILAIVFSSKFIQEEQISWSCNILKLILQDWLMSPLISLFLNYVLVRCLVDLKRINPTAKSVGLAIIDQNFLAAHNTLKECQGPKVSEQKVII